MRLLIMFTHALVYCFADTFSHRIRFFHLRYFDKHNCDLRSVCLEIIKFLAVGSGR
jgi:hypothetical protein